MSELRASLVTPLSGPLSDFGRATAAALHLWASEAVDLPRPWRRVRLELEDAHPDPAAAMQRALVSHPHLLFGPYGSGAAMAALSTTQRVVWNHGGAVSSIRWPAFPGAVNVLAPASTYFRGILELVRTTELDEQLEVIVLHGRAGFAVDVAQGAVESAARLGFRVAAFGLPSEDVKGAASKVPDADIVLVAGRFHEEIEAARVLLRRRWQAAGFVAAGVEEVLVSLGADREGLLGPSQWEAAAAPEPDEGPTARWFVTRYRAAVGSDPPYPAAQAFAAGLLAARCLRDAGGAEDPSQLAAARALRCKTLYGDFRLDPETGRQVGHQVLTVQWQDGKRRVVWPPESAQAPFVYPRRRP